MHKTKYVNNGISILIYLITIQLWGWGADEIRAMGYAGFKLSFFVKFFIRHILSVNQLINQAPKIWGQYYNKSTLKIEPNVKNNQAKIIIDDYKVHPAGINYIEGFIAAFIEFIMHGKSAKVRQKVSKNGHHELLASWD